MPDPLERNNEFQFELYTSPEWFSITPSDTVNFDVPCRAVYVNVSGTFTAVSRSGNTEAFIAVAGCTIPISCVRVNDTGTDQSAGELLGLR